MNEQRHDIQGSMCTSDHKEMQPEEICGEMSVGNLQHCCRLAVGRSVCLVLELVKERQPCLLVDHTLVCNPN